MPQLSTEQRRIFRVRKTVKASGRLRLSVHRSLQHIYAQIIDDQQGVTLAAANSKTLGATGNKTDVAKQVGLALAQAARAKGISAVVFDRGSYKYHGRVKALADGAREGGLDF